MRDINISADPAHYEYLFAGDFSVQPTVADYGPSLIGQVAVRLTLERIINPSLPGMAQIVTPRIISGNAVRHIS